MHILVWYSIAGNSRGSGSTYNTSSVDQEENGGRYSSRGNDTQTGSNAGRTSVIDDENDFEGTLTFTNRARSRSLDREDKETDRELTRKRWHSLDEDDFTTDIPIVYSRRQDEGEEEEDTKVSVVLHKGGHTNMSQHNTHKSVLHDASLTLWLCTKGDKFLPKPDLKLKLRVAFQSRAFFILAKLWQLLFCQQLNSPVRSTEMTSCRFLHARLPVSFISFFVLFFFASQRFF